MNKIQLRMAIAGLVLLIGGTGCSTLDDKWGKLSSTDQKIEISMKRAQSRFDDGKNQLNMDLINQAKSEWGFLVENFSHEPAKQKMVEADQFVADYLKERKELAAQSMKKKNLFTAAGYYKQILRLVPGDMEAKAFLDSNAVEIEKRLQTNLDLGNKAIKSGNYAAARLNFSRVLVFDPTNEAALKGIKSIPKTTATAAKQTAKPEQKEDLYKKGVEAFEKKDYLRAFEILSTLDDSSYKDTTLYIQRSQDKIQALGLDDTDN